MIGKSLGHYEITARIGRGGMGEVYRARDTKLDRDIALKVLPSEMAEDPESIQRFQREAKALAALNHPNIVTIYSVESEGGLHFLTMELLGTETLQSVIRPGGLALRRVIGDFDGAMQLLEQSVADREISVLLMPAWVDAIPAYAPIRSHPRYALFLEKMGFQSRLARHRADAR